MSPGILRNDKAGVKPRIEVIDSELRRRLRPDIVRRFSVRFRSGLHIRLLIFVRERSEQFFRVRLVRDVGQRNDRIGSAEKWPLNWTRRRFWGQGIPNVSVPVMEVDWGRRRVCRLTRLLRLLLRSLKGIGVATSERSR
jgi:hypothetical protein